MNVLVIIPYSGVVKYKMEDCVESLKILGHKVRKINLERAVSVPGGVITDEYLSQLLQQIKDFRPDFILTSEDRGIHHEILPKLKIPYVCWFTSNPLRYRIFSNKASPYCIIFVWDTFYIDEFRKIGFNQVFYLPLATNPKVFKEIVLTKEEEEKYECDVSFVGNSGYAFYEKAGEMIRKLGDKRLRAVYTEVVKRKSCNPLQNICDILIEVNKTLNLSLNFKSQMERELFEQWVDYRAAPMYRKMIIERLKHLNLFLYGDAGWIKFFDEDIKYMGRAERADLPLIYNGTKINLNITNPDLKNAINQRVFDIFACNGFLLTDYREDLKKLFDIKEEIVYNLDTLEEKVNYFLSHKDEAIEIARSGRERILREHTYKERIEEIIGRVQSIFG